MAVFVSDAGITIREIQRWAAAMTIETTLPLEDSHLDILGKAQRGLKLDDEELAKRAGVSQVDYDRIQDGEILLEPLGPLALALGLGRQALADAACKAWQPQSIVIAGLKSFTTRFEDMTVNSFLVWEHESREAAGFDTGADVAPMLDFAAHHGLTIKLMLITHTHPDHVADLQIFSYKSDAPVFVGDREPRLEGATPFAAGRQFTVGHLTLDTRLTWGHADGGITYSVNGLAQPVAILGDAIFAGSVSGGKVSYADAMRTTREQILSLSRETVLCPGHGPLTTVGEELQHNPFFATSSN